MGLCRDSIGPFRVALTPTGCEATGIASRVVAYAISAIFVVMAFIPGLMRFFTLMPTAVVGATFIFTSCAIMKGGLETIASRMLDTRRTLVVGLALLTGLGVEAFPGFFRPFRPRSNRWSARRWSSAPSWALS